MPYAEHLILQGRVIHITVNDELTLEVTQRANDDMLQRLNASPYRLHMLLDIAAARQVPTHLKDIWSVTEYLRHRRMGCLMVVHPQPPPTVQMLARVLARSQSANVRFVASVAEGLRALHQIDPTLPQDDSRLV
jgi:hypothetical protein